MDVGTLLRRTRTRQGKTLEQLAQSTKISVATLDALENNDFERLPASIYTRGFLRTYAREIGLDPEETVDQYLAQFEEPPSLVMADSTQEREAAQRSISPASSAELFYRRQLPGPLLTGAIAVILAVAYFAYASRPGRPVETPATGEPQPAAASDVAQTASPPEQPPPAPPSDVVQAANVAPEVLRVELAATGPCWLSVGADAGAPAGRLMQAGERQTVEAREELALRVGDPGTLSMSINGAPARPLGQAGQPVTVRINKQNFREFLRPV